MIKRNFTNYITNSILLLVILSISFGCSKSEYDTLVKAEMNKNVIYDSLFMTMEFGITKQEFFNRCWKLNKQELVKQGPRNNFVEYKLKDRSDADKTITMLFYGTFNDEKIMTGLDLKFYYEAWSLWNKSLHSNVLLEAVQDSLKSWFPGNDFIKVNLKNQKEVLVKIDGNRRILIESLKDDREIDARIDDLRYIIR